jgi:hypothetical protein
VPTPKVHINKKDHTETANGPNKSIDNQYQYIPVDFIKCEVINFSPSELLNNKNLNFVRTFNEDTGELQTHTNEGNYIKQIPRIANYKGLRFIIYDNGKMYFLGSLHKFYNDGLHNYNDFNSEAYQEVLKCLEKDFKLLPIHLRIQTLEYGLNFIPPIATDLILKHCLVHKRQNIIDSIPNANGKYKQAKHQKYILKLYNKAKQYGLSFELMRIEIKQTNWSEYVKMGIATLEDFNFFNKVYLINKLIKNWDSVIFYDPTISRKHKQPDYSNILYWDNLNEKSNNTYYNHVRKIRILNLKGNNIQSTITMLIIDKMNSLQNN